MRPNIYAALRLRCLNMSLIARVHRINMHARSSKQETRALMLKQLASRAHTRLVPVLEQFFSYAA